MELMKIIDILNKIANGEKVPKKIRITILGDRIILERVLNEKVEVIEEDKKIEIPKHIPNEVIQDLDRAICPANVKCIAHKVNELINYLQHINKGENNE